MDFARRQACHRALAVAAFGRPSIEVVQCASLPARIAFATAVGCPACGTRYSIRRSADMYWDTRPRRAGIIWDLALAAIRSDVAAVKHEWGKRRGRDSNPQAREGAGFRDRCIAVLPPLR